MPNKKIDTEGKAFMFGANAQKDAAKRLVKVVQVAKSADKPRTNPLRYKSN
jgi:hypothetical protein